MNPDPDTENSLEQVQIAVRISYVRMVELGEESGLSLKISQHIVCCLLLDRKNSKVKKQKISHCQPGENYGEERKI
jgi:hypothetical protein